jgi:hypothetical protein
VVAVGSFPGFSGSPVSADDIHPDHYVFCPEGIRFNMGGRQKSHQIPAGLLFGDGAVCSGKTVPTGLIDLFPLWPIQITSSEKFFVLFVLFVPFCGHVIFHP